MQQVGEDRDVSVTERFSSPGAPSRGEAPTLQDSAPSDGVSWRRVPLRSSVPLPSLSNEQEKLQLAVLYEGIKYITLVACMLHALLGGKCGF